MRAFSTWFTFVLIVSVIATFGALAQKTPPDKIVFTTKNGNVTFDHAAHIKRVDGKCAVCHDTLFKQDKAAPLNFKAGLHKPAETGKTSCGFCHNPGGPAFESKGNCAKCHVKS